MNGARWYERQVPLWDNLPMLQDKENTLLGTVTLDGLTSNYLMSHEENEQDHIHLKIDSNEKKLLPVAIVFSRFSGNYKVNDMIWEGTVKTKDFVWNMNFEYNLELLNKHGKIKFSLDLTKETVELCIYLTSAAFSPLENVTDDTGVNKKKHSGTRDSLKWVIQWFHELKDESVQFGSDVRSKKKSVEELYQYVQDHSKDHGRGLEASGYFTKYQSSNLLPTLRNYQAKAIHWMICQEKFDHSIGDEKGVHPLWQHLTFVNGDVAYLNVYSGKLTKEFPKPTYLPRGGILADEMGLGKTVEVLALHFNNPRPEKHKLKDQVEEQRKRSLSHDHDYVPFKMLKTEMADTVPVFANVQQEVSLVLAGMVDQTCQKLDAKKKKRKGGSQKAFQSVVSHGDYQVYKDRVFNPIMCCICSQEVKDQKIKCNKCPNIFHLNCSGYGKTALEDYDCPHCSMKKMVESHCTLIVCPDTLQQQWFNEIKMHVKKDTIKYMVYEGVKIHKFLPPKVLGEYDIIITSFNTLRQDFNYVKADDACRRLRHRKRYAVLPCPLLAINFWRMAIDEAQMVEADNTKLAEMCLRISAVHRWCVTGTPFKRGIEDIYGLLLFLGVKPYSNKLWWHRALLDHHQNENHLPLFDTLAKLTWRSCKDDVIDQIQIPKQTEFITWLQLSAIERHYYQKEFEYQLKQKDDALKFIPNRSVKISDLAKSELNKFLWPLLQLRQASVHPGVVTNGHVNFEKKCVSMDKVLLKLIESNKLECEEAHRKLICALNGLAGIAILRTDYNEAAKLYQDAMKSWNGVELKTDSLQKLHTLHNVLELQETCKLPKDSCQGVDWETIKEEKCLIRNEYMANVNNSMLKTHHNFKEFRGGELLDAEKKLEVSGSDWWLEVLDYGEKHEQVKNSFHAKILDELESVTGACHVQLTGRSRYMLGMKMVVQEKIDAIHEQRTNVLEGLLEVVKQPSKEIILATAECCLRPGTGMQAPKCCFCTLNKEIDYYELCLHSNANYREYAMAAGEVTSTGFRGETQIDVFMKFMSTSAQHLRMEQRILEAGRNHLKYFEKLKKEFNLIRSLYLACHGRVQAIDELEMCISRLRFPTEFELMTELLEGKNGIVRPRQVSQTRYALLSDRVTASEELKQKNGQMSYLQNLAKVQEENNGTNPEPCPICVFPLGCEWAIMACGHCVCCKCMTTLQRRNNFKRAAIQCPMCRAQSKLTAISIVTAKPTSTSNKSADIENLDGGDNDIFDSNVSVQGNFSTKIEAVVRRILWIRKDQPDAKTLVFSTWANVLKVISQALGVNNVEFKSLAGAHPKQFERSLNFFKESKSCNVLLLPLHSGAKGLNIIEASHVILTEPALNPSDELQAVGRVHRIGQEKETYVHRFFVRDTVEEKMYHLFKPKTTQEKNALENELTVDDVVSLIQKTQEDEGDVFPVESTTDDTSDDEEEDFQLGNYFV